MMLKLTLTRGSLLRFGGTECSSHDGNSRSVPFWTFRTTWSVFTAVNSVTGGLMMLV
jgi:hypothetical protein